MRSSLSRTSFYEVDSLGFLRIDLREARRTPDCNQQYDIYINCAGARVEIDPLNCHLLTMASPKFRLPLIRTILAFVILHSSHAKNDIIPGLIHLPTIPTETCDGTEGKGTATFSTQFPGNTGGVINIDPAGFGDQKGAQWKLCKSCCLVVWPFGT